MTARAAFLAHDWKELKFARIESGVFFLIIEEGKSNYFNLTWEVDRHIQREMKLYFIWKQRRVVFNYLELNTFKICMFIRRVHLQFIEIVANEHCTKDFSHQNACTVSKNMAFAVVFVCLIFTVRKYSKQAGRCNFISFPCPVRYPDLTSCHAQLTKISSSALNISA